MGVALRSAGVGAVATAVDLLALALLSGPAGLGTRAASPFALVAGLSVQFLGNKLVAFGDRSPRWGRQAAWFLGVEALGLAANGLAFDAIVRAAPAAPWPVVRLLVQAAVYWGLCLPLWSRIFAPAEEAA